MTGTDGSDRARRGAYATYVRLQWLLYELPREMWEGDIDAGINYFQPLPTEGEEALKDDLENAPRFSAAAAG